MSIGTKLLQSQGAQCRASSRVFGVGAELGRDHNHARSLRRKRQLERIAALKAEGLGTSEIARRVASESAGRACTVYCQAA